MALSFSSSTGNLFNRLGKWIKQIRNVNGFIGETLPVGDTNDASAQYGLGGATVVDLKTSIDGIQSQYASANQNIVDGVRAQQSTYRSAHDAHKTYCADRALVTIQDMIFADAATPSKDKAVVMAELVRQMNAASASVKANTVSVSATAAYTGTITISGSPTGGNIDLTIDGAAVDNVAYNASASTLQTALRAGAFRDASQVTVSGSAGGPWTIVFPRNVSVSVAYGDLTGGTSPTAAWAANTVNNTSTLTFIASSVGPDGKSLEYAFPETLTIIADKSAQASGTTAGSEPLPVKGELAISNGLAYDWPNSGSGVSVSITVVDPTIEQQSNNNILKNGSFDTASGNTLTGWTLGTGAAGTEFFVEPTTVYRSGGKSAKFYGAAGATLPLLRQTFGSDTSISLKPNTAYHVHFRARSSSASLVAGAIRCRLVDGSNAVISDDAGNANSLTLAYSAITTTWQAFTVRFTTPKVLPSTCKLEIGVSTDLTDGESVYVDDLAMCAPTALYAGGPYLSAVRGDTDVAIGDRWAITVANDQAGIIQTHFDRMFGMRAMGLQLPSSGSPTIAESLVS